MATEVREGLEATPPTLPSRYFYDARGSALFDRITSWYTDADEQFAVTLLRRQGAPSVARSPSGP